LRFVEEVVSLHQQKTILNSYDYETDSFIIQVTDGSDDDGMYDNESCPEV
jgi:hypothetical protein